MICAAKLNWEAELHLGFVRQGAKTLLAKRRHRGPLTVQRPFYPEGSLCHVYLLHPPGGVVAGDRLSIDIHVGSEAEVLITTPGAGKFYRSAGEQSVQRVALQLDEGAVMEWLPQESIVYEGARLRSDVNIDLSIDTRFIGWEILALGRPAADEGFTSGEVILNWRIYCDGKPRYLERMHLNAGALNARWGLDGHTACGTLFAWNASTANLHAVRSLIGDVSTRGVTLLDNLLICRMRAEKTAAIRRFFEQVRSVIRKDIIRRVAYKPRIWAT